MINQEIRNNFIEARQLLDNFMADEQNWRVIKNAGQLLLSAFRQGNKAKIFFCSDQTCHFKQFIKFFVRNTFLIAFVVDRDQENRFSNNFNTGNNPTTAAFAFSF